jgi:hypothetical protein
MKITVLLFMIFLRVFLLPHLATLRGEVAPVAEVVAMDSAVSLKRMGLRSSK